MYVELSSECAEDDPVLVVPWTADADEQASTSGSSLGPEFVDLREDPFGLDLIPEAEQHPPLLQALRALNAPRSPVFTAKCDAWQLDAEELEAVRTDLMVDAESAAHGFGSYVDLVWRERTPFVSFHQTEQVALRLLRLAESLELPDATLGCVVRPALVDLVGPQEGFAVSLYVKAIGGSAPEAYQRWAEALAASVALLRGKGFAPGNRPETLQS